MAKLFILGAGGFGTALAVMSQANGHEVTMWSYREDEAAQLRTDRENRRLLPGVKIPEEIAIVTDFAALGEAELVLIAVPSSAVRSVSAQLHGRLAPGAVVVCVSKGFEPETLKRMDEVIAEELPENPCVILSGPSHAEEVAKGIPTTVVAACRDLDMAERVQMTLSGDTFRIYVTDDVIGAELGGALKNVIALAAGALDGLGLGGQHQGSADDPRPHRDRPSGRGLRRPYRDFRRTVGHGGPDRDLYQYALPGTGGAVSWWDRASRAPEAVKQVGMTVEGYTNTKNAYEMGRRLGVEMPITNEVYKVLYEGKDIRQAIADLMGRPRRHESEYTWLQEGNLSR